MADAYVAAIRRVQPSGPYPLVGWSLGALVARAMAERLEAAGESVPVLAALDAPADGAPDRPSARSSASAAVEARLGALIRRRAIRKGFLRADAPAFWGEAILACLRRATAQAAAYRGGGIAAPTLLVRAMGEPGARLDDPAFDWRSATAGGVKILALGARHADLGDPEWAGAIAAALAPRLPG